MCNACSLQWFHVSSFLQALRNCLGQMFIRTPTSTSLSSACWVYLLRIKLYWKIVVHLLSGKHSGVCYSSEGLIQLCFHYYTCVIIGSFAYS